MPPLLMRNVLIYLNLVANWHLSRRRGLGRSTKEELLEMSCNFSVRSMQPHPLGLAAPLSNGVTVENEKILVSKAQGKGKHNFYSDCIKNFFLKKFTLLIFRLALFPPSLFSLVPSYPPLVKCISCSFEILYLQNSLELPRSSSIHFSILLYFWLSCLFF